MTNEEIFAMSPQQAGEALAAMKPQAPTVDLAAPVNIAAMSPTQARERLEGLKANPEWQRQFLSANGPTLREYNELSTKAAEAGGRLEAVLEHGDDAVPIFETTSGTALSSAKLAKVVDALYDVGLEPDHIREAFDEDRTIDFDTYAAVLRLKERRFADADYVRRYLAGSPAEVREMALIHIVLGMNIAEAP
jgi:hypothetical protein